MPRTYDSATPFCSGVHSRVTPSDSVLTPSSAYCSTFRPQSWNRSSLVFEINPDSIIVSALEGLLWCIVKTIRLPHVRIHNLTTGTCNAFSTLNRPPEQFHNQLLLPSCKPVSWGPRYQSAWPTTSAYSVHSDLGLLHPALLPPLEHPSDQTTKLFR